MACCRCYLSWHPRSHYCFRHCSCVRVLLLQSPSYQRLMIPMMNDLRSAAEDLSHSLPCLNELHHHRYCRHYHHSPHHSRRYRWPSAASPQYQTSSAPQPYTPRKAAPRYRSGSPPARRRGVYHTIVCRARGARGGSERSGRWRRGGCPRRRSGRRCWNRHWCLFFWLCFSELCCGGDGDS